MNDAARNRRLWGAAMLALGVAVAWLPRAHAQGMSRHGDIVLHTSAIATLELSRDVALRHAITRSANRALLTVAVQRDRGDDSPEAIRAEVRASATNPSGQRQEISLREIRDGTAIYYLGEPRTSEGELLRFEIEVLAEGEKDAVHLRFAQAFYAPLRP